MSKIVNTIHCNSQFKFSSILLNNHITSLIGSKKYAKVLNNLSNKTVNSESTIKNY